MLGYVPASVFVTDELLEGETVTAGGDTARVPQNPQNVNDRDHLTKSVMAAAFAPGTHEWWWQCDFGSAVEVVRLRVWDPVGSDYFNNPAAAEVRWSDDGSAWTTASTAYSSATVDSGLTFPDPETATEYSYDLVAPLTHRYWRMWQSAPGGLVSGRGMSEWFVDGFFATATEFVDAPETVDGADGTSVDVDAASITDVSGVLWRGDLETVQSIGQVRALIGFASAGDVTVLVQAGDASDWSDAATIVTIPFDATGSLTADELDIVFDAVSHRYLQLVLDSASQDVRVFEVSAEEAAVIEPQEPGRAILEIYVHDEDASRWGTATWATGPATGTEGIWSAAGWTDITPEGVGAHVIWGSRRPSRGILHQQDGASWNVETYDPDRDLDPGNMDSPYWPQLVAGLPIRISHESTVIRTGYVDEMTFKHKPPYYQGQILATDTIALLHKASVPADSILSNTLHARVIDAIVASDIAVGGIPLPPPDYGGPTLSDWVEGAATDAPTSVWEVIRRACEEVLWVPYINHDASLGLRSWGAPLNRGREISAPNLEDLTSRIDEDGVYSVARVQPADPEADIIEREAAPLPRYGRRVYERSEPTINPDDWAAAVLAERSWPGVQYIPGTVHCFTAADVDYFGSLQIMERIQVTVAGAVSVSGRLLGGELWVEHRGNERASWMFNFAIATDGATAIGLDTLVSDQGGDFLIDDQTDTDFLEAD